MSHTTGIPIRDGMARVYTVDTDLVWSGSWLGCVVDIRSGNALSTQGLRAAAHPRFRLRDTGRKR